MADSGPDAAQRAEAAFRHWYGRAPDQVWSAPGRVNLVGEHTDYNDGLVLPFALAQRTAVAATPRADGVLNLRSLGSDDRIHPATTLHLERLTPDSTSGWSAYPAAVAWALRQAGLPVGGVDLVVASDVPSGAGLASSHALECAIALALTGLVGLAVDRCELARLVQRAENDFVGAPTGLLDQSAALRCTAGHALLFDIRTMHVEQIPLDLAGGDAVLLVVDSRVHHSHRSSGYAQRRAGCERAARLLRLPALRDLPVDAAASATDDAVAALPAELRGLVRHVVTENARVTRTAALLRRGALRQVGAVLSASHASLREDYRVSCPELDTAVEATEAAGAWGARMTGGGFGGSVIALVPAAMAPDVAAAVRDAFARRGFSAPRIFEAAPSAAAGQDR